MFCDALAVIGLLFSFFCIGLGLFFVGGLCFNYCCQKYCGFDSFVRVVEEARRQGVSLRKREGE